MKFSKFNNRLFHKDQHIIANTLTQQFLMVDEMLIQLMDSAEAHDDFEGLQHVHPSFYDSLIKNGFIVNKDVDEIERVRSLIHAVDRNEKTFQLMVNPTMNCNFKCWYCYETHIKGSKTDKETKEKIYKFIDNILETMPKLEYFSIAFFGGEPLLYFNDAIVPIIEHGREACAEKGIEYEISFTTNGYLINQDKIDLLKAYAVSGLQITLDGHREFHDVTRFVSKNKGSYDQIVSNIKLLARNGFSIALRINYTAKNVVSCLDILKDFEDLEEKYRHHISISMNKVWQEQALNLEGPVNEFHRQAEAFGFTLPDAFEGDRVRNSCYADKMNQAVINYNGDVYKCNARDFTKENREGVLMEDGTVDWNYKFNERINVKLKNKPCLECSILPICGGGCSQQALEYAGEDYCVNDFDEDRKMEIVLSMFLSKNTKNTKELADAN